MYDPDVCYMVSVRRLEKLPHHEEANNELIHVIINGYKNLPLVVYL